MPTDYSSFSTDFSDIEVCKTLITSRLGSLSLDAEVLLELSSGTDADDQEVFRPYFVMGELLGIDSEFHKYKMLKGASGSSVEYKNPSEARDRLWEMQSRLDERFGLTLPDGYEGAGSNLFEATF